ncbi:hypothetical protein NDU88_001758 [Pleurodeles waltl]|uniref:Uncharacterized protein n=1 Tax=Pleurodeles waltl TaxID=8319 RepID=A0AAV7R815_PLEWA|nr:hypothetical protein NDU88_001758 [Pleurodeles waltl]
MAGGMCSREWWAAGGGSEHAATQSGVLRSYWHSGRLIAPPSEGIPDLLVQLDHGCAAWVDPIAEVVRPGAGVGLCARAPAEGPGWARLSALVNNEERGHGDRLWFGCVGAEKE